MEPANHFVPLCLEEGFGSDVDVGQERHANALVCSDLGVLGFQREMEIVHVEDVPRLAERSRNTQHVIWHQPRFDDGFLSTVPVVPGTLGQQAGHLSGFVLQPPHQVTVLRVARFIDQANGHRFVLVALVSRGFCDQPGDFLVLTRESRVLDDQFPNFFESVGETCGNVGHFPFGDGIACDVKVNGDVT